MHMHALQKIPASRLESEYVLLRFFFFSLHISLTLILKRVLSSLKLQKRNFKFVDIVFLYSCWNPPVLRLVFGDAEKNVLNNKE